MYALNKNKSISFFRIEHLGRKISIINDFRSWLELRVIVNNFKPDVIHTHAFKAGLIGRLIFGKHKHVHTFHGHLLHGYFGQTKTKFLIWIEKLLGIITNQFLVVGQQVTRDLIDAKIAPAKKFKVMPPGLEIRKIPLRTEILSKYGLDPNLYYCTFLGRVTAIKNPDRFLSLAEYFANRNDKICFLLVGDGELLEYCRQKIEEKHLPVIALGWVAYVEEILAITDLMILSISKYLNKLSYLLKLSKHL